MTPTSQNVSLSSSDSVEIEGLKAQIRQLQHQVEAVESRKRGPDISGTAVNLFPRKPGSRVDVDSGSSCGEDLVSHSTQLVHFSNRRCNASTIVLSNGLEATHHVVSSRHVKALHDFCISKSAAGIYFLCKDEILMIGGLRLDSDDNLFKQLVESSGATSSHVIVGVGFLFSNDFGDSTGISLADCSLDCHPIDEIATHCILGLPTNRPDQFDCRKPLLEYTHRNGNANVSYDDFCRLIEGRWISEGFVFLSSVSLVFDPLQID